MTEKKEFFKIIKTYATLSTKDNITKEFNLIQYEKLVHPILDIRKWETNKDNKKMLKGITITKDEARLLKNALIDYFNKEDLKNIET